MDTRAELKDYATEYTIKEDLKLVWRGKSWAITDRFNNCYNKITKEWEYESLPSNRTDKFFEECRMGLVEAKELVFKLAESYQ